MNQYFLRNAQAIRSNYSLPFEFESKPTFSLRQLAIDSMQGLMGNYLERSIHAFHEAQKKFQSTVPKIAVGEFPKMGPEAWQPLLNSQGPGLQNMLGDYLEKSASSVVGMQEELRKQAMQLFAFPLAGGITGTEADKDAPVGPVVESHFPPGTKIPKVAAKTPKASGKTRKPAGRAKKHSVNIRPEKS